VDRQQGFEDALQLVQVQGVGAVGFGFGGVVVDLQEDAVNASRNRRARQHGNELRLAAGLSARSRGGLDGVGGVEDDRGHCAHDGQAAHVDDQVVVAKTGAALGERNAGVAALADFFNCVAHVPGSDELPLFYVDGAAGLGGGDQQVGLAAEEGRNLENGLDIAKGVRELGGLLGGVDVGEDGEAVVSGDAAEDARALLQSRPSKAVDRRAVGLVVAGFEDVRNLQIGGDALDRVGEGAGVGLAFEHAGARDEEEVGGTCSDGTDGEVVGMAHVSIGAYWVGAVVWVACVEGCEVTRVRHRSPQECSTEYI